MNIAKISYLVTVKNEEKTLSNLLEKLINNKFDEDEIIILDDFSTSEVTIKILDDVSKISDVKIFKHNLDKNYGLHKNHGIQKCSGDWIFQIDGDELPSDILIFNIRDIISTNQNIELIYVPRINAWPGLTELHAKSWGWKLDISPTYNRFRAAWPDYQSRVFKNDYPRIKWHGKLHETIKGSSAYAFLPVEEDFALYHDKTIEKQIETNVRYNKEFTEEENKGISNPRT